MTASLRKRGFTLIELLVVVAIIGILAAILFPVFSRARENARRVSCASNLKQVGLGLYQYLQDSDEIFPVSWYGPAGSRPDDPSDPAADRYKWMDAIFPYIKSEQVYTCPSETLNRRYIYYRTLPSGNTSVQVNGSYIYGSYSINLAYYHANDGRTPPVSIPHLGNQIVNLASLQDASGTVYLGEVDDTNPTSPSIYTILWSGGNPTIQGDNPRKLAQGGTPGITERHLETTNVLFCDGHVKAMKLDALAKTDSSGTMTAFTIEAD